MHPYSWPLFDPCTIIKHVSEVFCLQIPHMPCERLAGDMHSIYKIRDGKPVYTAANVKQNGMGHGRKTLTHLRMP